MNDMGQTVKEAYPGEAVHMTGFKTMPEVGNPLYVVNSLEESRFIISRIRQRATLDAARRLAASGQIQVHDLKSQIGKLTKLEKRAIRGGDKTVLYERLGLLEEKDLKKYFSKYGIKKGEVTSEQALEEELEGKSNIGRRRTHSKFAQKREAEDKEHLMTIYHDLEKQKKEEEEMDEEELLEAQAEKAKLKALFRGDEDGMQYYPLIIKAN